MLEYKEPLISKASVEGANYQFPPYPNWPDNYKRPDFEKWKKEAKESFSRNLVITLLYFLELPVKDISQLMQLSESRIRSIVKITKNRLFGKNYKSSIQEVEVLSGLLNDKRNDMRQYASLMIESLKGNAPEIKAVLYVLSVFGIRDVDDIRLFHNSIEFLEKSIGPVNLEKYEAS